MLVFPGYHYRPREMEDLKRLILPAIAALLLHGLLAGFSLPQHQAMMPDRQRQKDSIRIEINGSSAKEVVFQKQEKPTNPEVVSAAASQLRKAPVIEMVAPPIITSKGQKKVIIDPDRSKREEGIKKKNEDIDLDKPRVENRSRTSVDTASGSVVEQKVENAAGDKRSHRQKPAAESFKQAMPMYLRNRQPTYPEIARRRGAEGDVLLKVLVGAEGKVADIRIEHSCGHPSLDRAAMHSVKNWLFAPATRDGQAVAMWVDVPIRFQLKEKNTM